MNNAPPTQNTFGNVVRSFTLLSVGEIISRLLSFIATAHIARALGPSSFGLVGFGAALVTYFLLPVQGGFGIWGTREIARKGENLETIAGRILLLRLLIAVVVFAFFVLTVSFLSETEADKQTLLLFGILLFPAALSLEWVFYGLENTKAVALSFILTYSIYAAGLLLFVHHSGDVPLIPAFQAAGETAAVVFLLLLYLRKFPLEFNPATWNPGHLIRQTFPISIAGVMRTISYSFDILMVGLWMGKEMVGWYVAAYKIVLLAIGFGALYFRILLAPLSRFFHHDPVAVKKLVRCSLLTGSVAVLLLATVTTLFAQLLVHLIYGPGYENSIRPLQVLVWGAVFILLNGNFIHLLIVSNRQNTYMKLATLAAAVNVVLNLILIPRRGLIGAALATTGSEFLFLMTAILASRRFWN